MSTSCGSQFCPIEGAPRGPHGDEPRSTADPRSLWECDVSVVISCLIHWAAIQKFSTMDTSHATESAKEIFAAMQTFLSEGSCEPAQRRYSPSCFAASGVMN